MVSLAGVRWARGRGLPQKIRMPATMMGGVQPVFANCGRKLGMLCFAGCVVWCPAAKPALYDAHGQLRCQIRWRSVCGVLRCASQGLQRRPYDAPRKTQHARPATAIAWRRWNPASQGPRRADYAKEAAASCFARRVIRSPAETL